MTLIKSISGIRGTLGGIPGETLSPVDIVRFTSAYASHIPGTRDDERRRVVIGRDARTSGRMVASLVANTLIACGLDVIDLGLSTTPTVELAVPHFRAAGGIIITASHNPGDWNALKLLNASGEFISAEQGESILRTADEGGFTYVSPDTLGSLTRPGNFIAEHIRMILDLPQVDVEAIRKADLHVAVDAVNSTGGIAIPILLEALGVRRVTGINMEPDGLFAHNPEPLPEHLGELANLIRTEKADLGLTVDPDVDRLAIICEDGSMFGEEYTLVAVADYILGLSPGPVVSNLSSSRALRDVADRYGQSSAASEVGEVNVVALMKETGAVIGGEGNGGVIFPGLHYGRDALVGIALFLSHLARKGGTVSALRATYPRYEISKLKLTLPAGVDPDKVLDAIADACRDDAPDLRDGVKFDFPDSWVHLRKSNTEPIIRIYAEAPDAAMASELARSWKDQVSGYF